MAANSLGLGIQITARDMASGALRSAGRGVSGFQDRITRLGAVATQVFGGIVASAGALKLAFRLAKPFGEFEQGLTAVSQVATGGVEHLSELREAAIQAGIATQFSPKEAVDGLLDLTAAGQTATQATKTLIPVLDLAAGSLGQLGVSEASKAVVGTLNAYGMSAENAAGVTDKLLRITQLTNFQARDFSAGLAKAAAAGGTFNQSLESALITLGLMRNRNIDASSAATAYREVIRRLGSDQGAQKAIQKAGVAVFDESTGKMRDATNIMLDLADATQGMTDEERNRIVVQGFGARGLLAFAAIQKATVTTMKDGREVTLKGRDAIAAMRGELGSATGTAAKFKDAMLDTFEGQKTLLKGSLETLQVVGGEAVATALRPAVKLAIDTANQLIDFLKNMAPETRSAIGKMLVGFLGFISAAGAVLALKGALGLLLVILGPVGVAIGAVAALVGGAFAVLMTSGSRASDNLSDAFGGLGDIASAAWNAIKAFVSGVGSGFKQTIEENQGIIDAFATALSELRKAFGDVGGASDSARKGGESFGQIFGAIALVIVRTFTIAVNIITGFVKAWKAVGGALTPVTDALGNLIEQVKNALVNVGLMNDTVGESSSIWQALGSTIAAVISAVAAIIAPVVNFIASQIGALVNIFNGVTEFLAGVFTGNWARAWEGIKGIVVGVVKTIINLAASIVEVLAGSIDAVSNLVGRESHLAKSVEGIKKEMLRDVGIAFGQEPAFGVTVPGAAPPVPEAPMTMLEGGTPEAPMTMLAPEPRPPSGFFTPATTQVGAGMGFTPADYASALATGARSVPPGITKATLTVDGQTLGELAIKAQADAANEGSVPVEIAGS